MTEALDYTTWTFQDHLDAAVTLAAAADELADGPAPGSQVAMRREHIRQTAARGLLHAKIAELKKPQPAAPEPAPRQTRQRTEKNTDS